MKVEYINPFLESLHEFFGTMLGVEANRGQVRIVDTADVSPTHDLTAVIGLSGPVRGTVALALPASTAIAIVNRLLGIEASELDEMVIDGVSEAVNIIAGSAKPRLVQSDGPPVELGLPTVVEGKAYVLRHPSGTAWLEVPFTSELGSATLRVAFEEGPAQG